MERNSGLVNRVEIFIRRLFERIGGAIDFALRRGGQQRTDLSALIPQIERAIESHLRQEGTHYIAPNLIELRYDYETYTSMGQKRRDFLERELSSNVYEYAHNRRYQMQNQVKVRIAYDAFTRGLEIKTDFGEGENAVIIRSDAGEGAGTETGAEPKQMCEVILQGIGSVRELRARLAAGEEPLGVGRNIANRMVIKDPTVSNFHAAFVLRPDGALELADRGSANGTCVNGVLLGSGDKAIVRDGDRVRFGDVELTLTSQSL